MAPAVSTADGPPAATPAGPWLVDGMNVIGSRPDGWWRDRPGARRRLVASLGAFVKRTGAAVEVVFDGREEPDEVAAGAVLGVAVRFAPGGRDAADDVIATMVASMDDPAAVTVVTSDAGLARRVAEASGRVVGVSVFRRLLEG